MTPAARIDIAAFSWKSALLQIALIGATVSASPGADLVSVALALWALRGALPALQSLSLFVVIRTLNPLLVHWGLISTSLSWALPFIVAIRILPLITNAALRVVLPIWLFSIVAISCSVLTSPAVAVSIMKAFSLAVIAATVLVASSQLHGREVRVYGNWLVTLAVVVATLSLVTLVNPAIAHFPDTGLLQGIFNQPQTLGSFLAPFSSFYLAHWLFRDGKIARSALACMTIVILCMLLTMSRNAAIATILGVTVSLWPRRANVASLQRSDIMKYLRLALLAVVAIVALQRAGGGVSSSVSNFILKRGETSVGEAFSESRGGGLISQLRNFASSPIVGHGFGVYADGKFPTEIVKVAGIPVSAPVEKGVLPSAVLEETGVLGFGFFVYMIFLFTRNVWQTAKRPVLAMFCTCLLLNLGEAVLLSPGNVGLHLWLLIGWSMHSGNVGSGEESPVDLTPPPLGIAPRPFGNLLD